MYVYIYIYIRIPQLDVLHGDRAGAPDEVAVPRGQQLYIHECVCIHITHIHIYIYIYIDTLYLYTYNAVRSFPLKLCDGRAS